jgi:WhiB family redox-sensing transcriptional regulator
MRNHRQIYSYQEFYEAIEAAEHIPCREIPEIFFPDDFPVGSLRKQATKMAKDLCQECPVIRECMLYAITNNETFGVWGGKLLSER